MERNEEEGAQALQTERKTKPVIHAAQREEERDWNRVRTASQSE